MLIAIQDTRNSFSQGWTHFCEKSNLDYKLVNIRANSIMRDLKDCDLFLWNFSHTEGISPLIAEALLTAVQKIGVKTFPLPNEIIHFDSKISQKYIFEAIGAPFVNTHLFFDEKECSQWIDTATFPKVFKLSKGAGATNVLLAQNREEAHRLRRTMFTKGMSSFNRQGFLSDRFSLFSKEPNKKNLILLVKSIFRLFLKTERERLFPKENGYAYFQDYIEGNDCDTRVVIIGKKAFAIRRMNREGDFRASGSGSIDYDHKKIDTECIKISYDICEKLGYRAMSFDFIRDNERPMITEMCYTYTATSYSNKCDGYWDKALTWHPDKCVLEEEMIKTLLEDKR